MADCPDLAVYPPSLSLGANRLPGALSHGNRVLTHTVRRTVLATWLHAPGKVSVEDGRSASGRRCRRSNPETRSQRCWMDRKGTIAKIEPLPMLVGVSTLAVRFSGHNGRQRIR